MTTPDTNKEKSKCCGYGNYEGHCAGCHKPFNSQPIVNQPEKYCKHTNGSYEKQDIKFCVDCHDYLSQPSTDWFEEFDNKFGGLGYVNPDGSRTYGTKHYAIQSFISEKIEEARKEYTKEALKFCEDKQLKWMKQGRQEERERIRKHIKEMLRIVDTECASTVNFDEGWNFSLEKLLKHLNSHD